MKILTQRLTHISAVATVLLIAKTFIVKYYDRRILTNRTSIIIIIVIIINETATHRDRRERERERERERLTD